jgi:hypothetical protein
MEGKPTQLHDRSVHIYQGDKEKIPELARKSLERRQGLLLAIELWYDLYLPGQSGRVGQGGN